VSEKKGRKRFRDRQDAENMLRRNMRQHPGLNMWAAIDYLMHYHKVPLIEIFEAYRF